VQGITNHIPHIQLDHFEPVKKDPSTQKKFVLNTDVGYINRLDVVSSEQYAINDKEADIIRIRDYITTHELLLDHMDQLYMDLATINEKYQQFNSNNKNMQGNKTPNTIQWSSARMIPAKHKQQILNWAENYKTYLIIKLADRIYSSNEKEALQARYKNDVGGLLKETLGSPAWQQEMNRIKHHVRHEGVYIYKQHYGKLLDLVKSLGKATHSSARSKSTQDLNDFIILFAEQYFTKTFPINNTCFNHIKCYIEKINRFKGTRIQLV